MHKKLRNMVILEVLLAVVLFLLALFMYMKGTNNLPDTEIFLTNTTRIIGGFLSVV